MQVHPMEVTPVDHKDLKSRHTLTNLLTEQLDLNEELSSENQLLASQQRRLILLLSQKDSQISKFRAQISAPDLTTRSLTSRRIQFVLLSHLFSKIQTKPLSSAFENLKFYCSEKSSSNDKSLSLRKIAEKLHLVSKSKALKSLMTAAFYFRSQLASNGGRLASLFTELSHKRLSHSFGKIKEAAINRKLTKSVKIGACLLLFNTLYKSAHFRMLIISMSQLKKHTQRSSDHGIENKVEVLSKAISNVFTRTKRQAFFNIRLKPYEEAAYHIMKVTITSKKFLGLQLLCFHLSKLQRMLLCSGWAKLQHAGLRAEAKIGSLFRVLEKKLGDPEKQAFVNLKLYSYAQQIQAIKGSRKVENITNVLNSAVKRVLTSAFSQLKGEKSSRTFDIPNISFTKIKSKEQRAKEKENDSDEWDRGYDNTWRKRKNVDSVKKGIPIKVAYSKLKQAYLEAKNQHAVQIANCMGMMGAKLMNFQQLNEQIIRESKETLRRSQELEEKLEMKSKKEKELNHKLEELMRATQQAAEQKTSIAVELSQAVRQLAAADEKVKGYERKCARLVQNNDELEADKAQLISKVQELMETLESMQNEYKKNQRDIKDLTLTNATLKDNLQEKTQEVVRLKERHAEIEEEFSQIKKATEKKLSASQGEKMSGELKELKNQISKLKKEKTAISDKYEEVATHNNRLKTSNAELTKEAIQLNEERNSFKSQFTALKDTNASMRRDMTILDNKLQKALHELEEKKNQLMQKIMNEKATPDYVNQVLDEKKHVENENRALRQQLDKMHKKITMYDNNTVKQADDLISLQKDSQVLRDERLTLRNEIKDLNESLANLNRDKVNLMREMTLINDKNVKLEKDAETYKRAIEELEQEIQNYQLQLDAYVQVLKTMEDKMNRLDSKTKLSMSMSSNQIPSVGSPSGYFPTQSSTKRERGGNDDDEELIARLKNIKNKVK